MKLATLIQATIVTALASAATNALANDKPAEMEKCYGIAKAGKNDCQTKSTSCAGTSPKDNQPDAFLVVPKGLCGKIAGGKSSPDQ